MSYKDIADKMGKPEPFVLAGTSGFFVTAHESLTNVHTRSVCTGALRPSAADFNSLAEALEIKDTVSETFKHDRRMLTGPCSPLTMRSMRPSNLPAHEI